MDNEIFIEMLKHIKSLDLRNKQLVRDQIDEYVDWLNSSLYNRHKVKYTMYIDTLNYFRRSLDREDVVELYGILSDNISLYYIMMDENGESIK